jgi:hypothetical protein
MIQTVELTEMSQQLEQVAGQRQAQNDANAPTSNSMPLDFLCAVLAAAESLEPLDSPCESSERHTIWNAEEPTRRIGSTGEAYFIERSSIS